jgi:hypothetical protein
MGHLNDRTLLGNWEFSPGIGAGGFVTDGNISNDGVLATHMDTGPGMFRRPTDKRWQRFIRAGENYTGSTEGIVGDICNVCRVAETDSDVMAAVMQQADGAPPCGYLFYTLDGAETVHRLETIAPDIQKFGCADNFRFDPNNAGRAAWGRADGLHIFDNYFDEYFVADLPIAIIGGHNAVSHYSIEFDRSSAVVGGKTQRIYVNVPGSGLYVNNAAGVGTWTLISVPELPPVYSTLMCNPDTGVLHLALRGGTNKISLNEGWVASSVSGEWYYETNLGVYPEPDALYHTYAQGMARGAVGSLAAGEWGWGDNDSIGEDRIYLRPPIDPNTAGDDFYTFSYYQRYWRYEDGEWAENPDITDCVRVVHDPHNEGRLLLPTEGSNYRYSLDDGLTVDNGYGQLHEIQLIRAKGPNDIKWHAWTNQAYMAHGTMFPDPNVPGRFWLYDGIGIRYADDLPTVQTPETPTIWDEYSIGIENMTMNTHYITPEGDRLSTFWDRVGLAVPKADWTRRFAVTNAPTAVDRIAVNPAGGQGMDYAPEDPNFLVCTSVEYGHTDPAGWEIGGYSTNRGRNWQRHNAVISDFVDDSYGGGNIVVFSKDVWVQVQCFSRPIVYTLNGARESWADMTPLFGENFHQGNSYANAGVKRKIITKDRFHPNTAYFYCIGNASGDVADLASRGIWKIVWNGPGAETPFTITRIRDTLIESFGVDYWNGQLEQYDDGHWLWCGGEGANYVWESKDNLVTWTPVGGSDDIHETSFFIFPYSFGVGGPAFPDEPNTVMVYGHRGPAAGNPMQEGWWHQYLGVWLCRNFNAPNNERIWKRISQYVDGQFGGFSGHLPDAAGDLTEFGSFDFSSWGVHNMRLVDRRRARAA